MLKSVAGTGYIVIAPNSDNGGWCVEQYKDQLRGIDIAYAAARRGRLPYAAIDWKKGVGLLGHSMGAHATVQSAGLLPHSPVKIAAAVAFAPQFFRASYADTVAAPVLYVSGAEDTLVPPSRVQQQYNDTPVTESKVFAEVVGFGHMGLAQSDSFSYFTTSFFNCYMLGRATGGASCDSIYDSSKTAWCPLCGNLTECPHNWPMKACETHRPHAV